ncbi:MAG: MFS transporter [Alphaproteobacteria bacterium]|nr:MFS transporter [Alphaproteobacteria bacterium]
MLCQALAMTGVTMLIVVSALAGKRLAADPSLATLPISLMFVGNMVMTIPASLLMKRIGRRAGFTVGALFGIAGALTGAWGLLSGSFAIFALGGLVQGCYNAFWQYYRFAAAEAVEPDYISRAISFVLLGGILAAVVGPELAKGSADLIDGARFAGSYLAVAGLAALSVLVIQFIDIPAPGEDERSASGRPLLAIAAQPVFMIAVLAAMVGYGSMSFVMTATPLAMEGHLHSFDDTAFVIQWHALGMFLPSLFSGHLIRLFGAVRIVLAGVIANFAMIAVVLSGTGVLEYWTGLVLLGIGWNFMFVGGSTLLTETYSPAEKGKVQGVNDFIVFGTNSAASLSSGLIYYWYGWSAIAWTVVTPLLAVFAMAFWLRMKRRAAARAA